MLRVATRGSALARWQAHFVAERLAAHGIETEFVIVSTTGDQRLDVPIHALGGTGVFVKEVQLAVLRGDADIAVHSAKDLPSTTADGLVLACVPDRHDARDALIGATLDALPQHATVATGSVRRRAQLHALRPDLQFAELRGNIDSRLDRARDFDAIVLAVAGVERIGRADELTQRLDVSQLVPQVGQGALAVECRDDDHATRTALELIDHASQHRCVATERHFLAAIGGGCDAPIGAHAVNDDDALLLTAIIADGTGAVHREIARGHDPRRLGADVASALLRRAGME